MTEPNTTPTKYIFVTGGVVSSLGQGHRRRVARPAARRARAARDDDEVRSVHQRRPGHDEPVPARRGVRHRRRRRDRPRPRPLRALHRPAALPAEQRHDAGASTSTSSARSAAASSSARTVQVIPHITDEIKAAIRRMAPENDVVIVEIGGTVGDIESLPFLEAIRQFRHDVGRDNALFVHLTLVPYIAAASEVKTKPTQHSVRELMEIGIQPDILICRTERPLSEDVQAQDRALLQRGVRRGHREPRCRGRSTRSRSRSAEQGFDDRSRAASSASRRRSPTSRCGR